ncbi:MAG: site-specific DNA-methyltransferase, partial [Chloroflexi bacterium]|nr:site-specific DNA-methyltransferase [Chloroflexota bacterium]
MQETAMRQMSLTAVEPAPTPTLAGECVEGLLIHGDAVKELPELVRSGRVFDVIIADPPYNIGKDFGNDDEVMPIDEYVHWTLGWLGDCFRLLADDGLIYLYGFPEIVARVAARFPIDEQRWLVWHYTNKTVPSLRFWQRSHETILCLWKPGRPRPDLEIDQIREPYTAAYLKAAGKVRKGTPSRLGDSGKPTVYNAHKNGAQQR